MKGPISGCLVKLRTDFEVFPSVHLDTRLRRYSMTGVGVGALTDGRPGRSRARGPARIET